MSTATQHIGPGTVVQSASGSAYILEAQRFQGGEGRIFSVSGCPDIYIKIYSRPLDLHDIAKLKALVTITDKRLPQISAWPTDIVSHGGTIVGIVMPAIRDAKPLYQLSNPSDRRTHFPRATYQTLVGAAANLARNLAILHQHGIVVGDLSPANALATERGLVFHIDCDSVQIGTFPCKVGLPEMLPPELQGQHLGSQLRSRDQDAFALAVMIHQLLYLGRHPYAGQGPIDIAQAIICGHHALDASKAQQFTRLTGVALDELVTPSVKQLFTQAFARTSRPSALEWTRALNELFRGLRACSAEPLHFYPGPTCPWCRIAASGRPSPFGAATLSGLRTATPTRQNTPRPAPPPIPQPMPQPATPAFYQPPPAQRRQAPSWPFNFGPIIQFVAGCFRAGAAVAGLVAAIVVVTEAGRSLSSPSYRSPPTWEKPETDNERKDRLRREDKQRKDEQKRREKARKAEDLRLAMERADQRRQEQAAREREKREQQAARERERRERAEATRPPAPKQPRQPEPKPPISAVPKQNPRVFLPPNPHVQFPDVFANHPNANPPPCAAPQPAPASKDRRYEPTWSPFAEPSRPPTSVPPRQPPQPPCQPNPLEQIGKGIERVFRDLGRSLDLLK